MIKVIVFFIFLSISQAPIWGEIKGVDMNKKSRLIGINEFKRYKVETLKLKKVNMQTKEIKQNIGPSLINKRVSVKFEEKASLRLINKYQFRRDLHSQNDIPLQKMNECNIK